MKSKFHVPFETAQQLKGKGYPQENDSFQECDLYYYDDGELEAGIAIDTDELDDCFYAPTYHEVVDWLEGKGIYVSAFLSIGETDKEDTYKIWWKSFIDIPPHEEQSSAVYSTREEALNDGILKALEML